MRRPIQLAAVLLMLTVATSGCGGWVRPVRVRVAGIVVDDVSAKPLQDALVSIAGASTTSSSQGTFSLTVNAGTRTLTVSKPGFNTVSKSVTISAPGPVNLGQIELADKYGDAGVTFADAPDGSTTFDVPLSAKAADQPSVFLMIFPKTDTAGDYPWTLTSTSVLADRIGSSMYGQLAKRSVRAASPSSRAIKNFFRPLGHDFRQPNLRADDLMRRREKEMGRYRSQILASLNRPAHRIVADAAVTNRTFRKYNFKTIEYVDVDATLQYSGTYADFYVDDGHPVDDGILADWSTMFDGKHAMMNAAFGNELDVDENGKVIILVSPIQSTTGTTVFGYFDPVNEADPSDEDNSNGADMIYVNPVETYLGSGVVDVDKLKGTLAHEFQHLIHFSERMTSGGGIGDIWITEAFATLAEDLVGYGYHLYGMDTRVMSVDDWLQNHNKWSLITWDSQNYDYGGAYLFGRYFYDRFGNNGTLLVNRSVYDGTRSFTDAVGGTFGDLFGEWQVALANRLGGRDSNDEILNYGSEFNFIDSGDPGWGLNGYSTDYSAGFNISSGEDPPPLRPWGMEFFHVLGGVDGGSISFTLSGSPSSKLGAVAVTF